MTFFKIICLSIMISFTSCKGEKQDESTFATGSSKVKSDTSSLDFDKDKKADESCDTEQDPALALEKQIKKAKENKKESGSILKGTSDCTIN